MVFKRIISLLTMILVIMSLPNMAFAVEDEKSSFTLFGIDFGGVWDFIAFWQDDTPKYENKEQNNQKPSGSSGTYKPPANFNVTIDGQRYTREGLISSMNSNQDIKNYMKGFGYECLGFETDKGIKITFYFDTTTGKVKNIKKSLSCEKEIFMEESLIEDVKVNGFEAGQIKSYLERVELPTSMYFKAIKVFTVG